MPQNFKYQTIPNQMIKFTPDKSNNLSRPTMIDVGMLLKTIPITKWTKGLLSAKISALIPIIIIIMVAISLLTVSYLRQSAIPWHTAKTIYIVHPNPPQSLLDRLTDMSPHCTINLITTKDMPGAPYKVSVLPLPRFKHTPWVMINGTQTFPLN